MLDLSEAVGTLRSIALRVHSALQTLLSIRNCSETIGGGGGGGVVLII